MKTPREESDNAANEEGAAKRQKIDQSSPQLAFENPLLPLASYDDDEEEVEERRDGGRGRGVNDGKGEGLNGHIEDEDEDEEDEESKAEQGRRNRSIEVRRDCPYLDTVNRQVYLCLKLGFIGY